MKHPSERFIEILKYIRGKGEETIMLQAKTGRVTKEEPIPCHALFVIANKVKSIYMKGDPIHPRFFVKYNIGYAMVESKGGRVTYTGYLESIVLTILLVELTKELFQI